MMFIKAVTPLPTSNVSVDALVSLCAARLSVAVPFWVDLGLVVDSRDACMVLPWFGRSHGSHE